MSATNTQWPTLEQFEAARRQLDDAVDAVQQMHDALSAFVAMTKANGYARLPARAWRQARSPSGVRLTAIVERLVAEWDIAAINGAAEAVAS